jgi:hypothetical protein
MIRQPGVTAGFALLIIVIGACQLTFAQGQETPYLPITRDNLDQLVPLFTLHCGDDRFRQSGASFSGDQFAFGCDSANPAFSVYSLSEQQTLWEYTGEQGLTRAITLLDGGNLVLVDFQQQLSLIRRLDQSEIASAPFVNLASVAVSPDRQRVAFIQGEIASTENTVVVYRLPEFAALDSTFTVSGYTQIAALALTTAAQDRLAIGENEGRIRVFRVETGVLELDTPNTPLSSGFGNQGYKHMAFSPDGTRLYVSECTVIQMGCHETGITVIEVSTGEIVREAVFPYAAFDHLLFTPDGTLLIAVANGQVHFLDAETLEEFESAVQMGGDYGSATQAALNETGTLLAVSDSPAEAYVIYGIPRGE